MSQRNTEGQRNLRMLQNMRQANNFRRQNRNEIYRQPPSRPSVMSYRRLESEFSYTVEESNKLCKNCDKVKIIIQRAEKANHDNQSSKSMCYSCHNNN